MKRSSVPFALIVWAGMAAAQQPLSAIEWLEQQNSVPLAKPIQPPESTPENKAINEPPAATSADITAVEVMPLGAVSADATGLLPTATTGLPRSLWAGSSTALLSRMFGRSEPDAMPAVQALMYTLLLAEADAPIPGPEPSGFLRARIQTLVHLGAVDPARALIERAGPTRPELFDLWLSLSLLSGDEDAPCAALRETPTLSADYAARVYCTARAGDWTTAALTYDTAVAIGAIKGRVAELLAAYLDPELAGSTPDLPPPSTPTPLVFRLYEANGTPLPTARLPRAFAMADLRGTAGWKAELEAAERLARTGALPATRLLGLYTDRSPAASGGIWDRVRAIQALDTALFERDAEAVASSLPKAWTAMKDRGLAVAFAQLFAERLMDLPLPDAARTLAYRVALLSPSYEDAVAQFPPVSQNDKFLAAIATGAPEPDLARSALETAVLKGLTMDGPAAPHATLLDDGKLGEAILAAALQLGRGRVGRERDVTEGLATLRHVGLEDTVRRAALQLLILGSDQ